MKNITFINAGAGSGKTYRLTRELTKAIKNKECKADEVLLTTFTKAAAEEIQIKARTSLLKESLFNESNDLQNAYIGTVHSVGRQIIQKFWHYIGFPKEIKVLDVNDVDLYFSQAIAKIPTDAEIKILNDINYRFNPTNGSPYYSYNESKWKEDLLRILNLARTNKISNFTASKEESLKYAKVILNINNTRLDTEKIGEAIDALIEIAGELPERGNKGRIDSAKKLSAIRKDNIKYSELSAVKKVIDDFFKKEFIGDEFSDVSSQLENYYRSKSILKDIEEYNRLLFNIAEKSIEKYAKYKQEFGLIDYSDMENGFLKLLDISEVQKEIQKTVKLVMVDEFQDSSPIQLAIFLKLSDIVDRSIWVGDPKQSIFEFRGTDPLLIETIINEFEEENREDLKTDNLEFSWRSRPEIVEIVNKIFVPALKDQVKEETIALEAVRTDKGFETKKALHHFNFIEEGGKNKGIYYKAIAKGVVKILNEDWKVSDKHKSKPELKNKENEVVITRKLKASDIAILCKGNEEVSAISKELSNLGIKCSSESDTLKATAEFKLITALIKLIISQENTLAKAEVKLLSDPNSNVSELIDERLSFLNDLPPRPIKPEEKLLEKTGYEEELKEYYKKLNFWGKENLLVNTVAEIVDDIKELPLPQLVEHLVTRLNIYSAVFKWGNGSQRHDNIQKIIENAYKYDERCINMNLGSSTLGFIHYLESQESLAESKSENDDAINVLTYHKSKGLEWPMVILTDFQKDVNWGFISRNLFGLFIKNKFEIDLENILSDRRILSLPWAFGKSNSKPSEDFISHIESLEEYKTAKLKHEKELKRLMYVGMTRPRDYMITTAIAGEKIFKWINLINEHENWDFKYIVNKETSETKDDCEDVFDRGVNFCFHNLELNEEEKIESMENNLYFSGKNINKKQKAEPYFISPSKVISDDDVKVSSYAEIQNRIPTGVSAKDKVDILGNCLHDILYLCLGNKINDGSTSIDAIDNIINNHQLKSVINAEEILESIDKLYDYITEEFQPKKWHRELSLETEIDGQLYKGEADLLLETDEGYILIDYKSYPGSIDRVLNAETNNYAGKYSGQLNIYQKMIENITEKKVVNKFIYYTVLGRLIKLE